MTSKKVSVSKREMSIATTSMTGGRQPALAISFVYPLILQEFTSHTTARAVLTTLTTDHQHQEVNNPMIAAAINP